MSRSFDFSSLLCDEQDDYSNFSDSDDATWQNQDRRLVRPADEISGGDLIGVGVFPVQSDEWVLLMLKKETDFFPDSDYFSRLRNGDLDVVSRVEAVDWIKKVIAHYNFGPLCGYLAVSYLDRFCSIHPPRYQDWIMQLAALGCLSLAMKMEENVVPSSVALQVAAARFKFEAKTIRRMELLVLDTLKWRMQAITPFSFIDNFLYKINGEKLPPQSAITQSTQLILSIIRGIEFLEYRPSEIAAAVAISVGLETKTVEVDKSLHLLSEYVQKDRLLECIEMISESTWDFYEGQSGNSTPCSPIGVLDIACLSYISDESPVESCANSPHQSKRRRLFL